MSLVTCVPPRLKYVSLESPASVPIVPVMMVSFWWRQVAL